MARDVHGDDCFLWQFSGFRSTPVHEILRRSLPSYDRRAAKLETDEVEYADGPHRHQIHQNEQNVPKMASGATFDIWSAKLGVNSMKRAPMTS
jgi:hypothetical protein